MNTQLINQIKALKGVKEVTPVNGMAVVVFEPRKPIFTTNDGVDVFDGDMYWFVDKTTNSIYINLATTGMAFNSAYLRFSTSKSAQKWIDEHKKPKPVYADPEDGTEFFDGDSYWYFDKYTCEVVNGTISNLTFKQDDETSSKIYKSRQLCELALAKFIMDKYK